MALKVKGKSMKKSIDELSKRIERYIQLEAPDFGQAAALHKLRVSARKLVALSPPESDSAQLFKRIIQASNSLRDLDVLRDETLKKLPKKWQKVLEGFDDTLSELRAELDAQFKLLLQMELSQDVAQLAEQLQAMQPKAGAANERHQLPLVEIEKRLNLQLKLLKKLEIDDKQVHKVRLKIKRLRYQIEHFYPQQHEALGLMTFLQDRLGDFQDLSQGIKWLNKHAKLDKKTLAQIESLLGEQKESILKAVRKQLNHEYRDFKFSKA